MVPLKNESWWNSDSAAFRRFKRELEAFEGLAIRSVDGEVAIAGSWAVFGETRLIARYQIEIRIPSNFPIGIPKVYETGGALRKISSLHFFEDESACLFAPPQRWEVWPIDGGIRDFLNGPVRAFFFSQAFYAETGRWPFGDWSHGDDGIMEYYAARFAVCEVETIRDLLQLSLQEKIHRQWKCPCDKKSRITKCHLKQIRHVADLIPRSELEAGMKIANSLLAAGTRIVERQAASLS